MTDHVVVDHGRIVRICGRLSTTADADPRKGPGLSRFADNMGAFNERLREAARHAGVEWSQTAVAKSLGYSKQTVDRWFGIGQPKPEQIFNIADRWKINARWLATGDGAMKASDSADREAKNAREEMVLLLFRSLTPEQQRELVVKTNATVDANREVQRRFLNSPLRTYSNEDVAAAFGKVPTAKPTRAKGRSAKGSLEEDPE